MTTHLGTPILGPRNIPIESANPDLLIAPDTDAGTIPNLKFPYAQAHNRVLSGGWAREVTTRELPVAKDLAGVNMRLKPGGIRELHWHKEAEWAYMIAGTARVTAIDAEGRNFIADVGPSDLWYFPAGIPHSKDMKVTERITRTDLGHMEIMHIIEDPKMFSRTWTFTTKPTLLKGELIEYICQENNKDVEHLVGK